MFERELLRLDGTEFHEIFTDMRFEYLLQKEIKKIGGPRTLRHVTYLVCLNGVVRTQFWCVFLRLDGTKFLQTHAQHSSSGVLKKPPNSRDDHRAHLGKNSRFDTVSRDALFSDLMD